MSAAPDFRVINHLGVVLFTSNDPAIAKAKARELADTHPHVCVKEVVLTEVTRTIYRPRINIVRAA